MLVLDTKCRREIEPDGMTEFCIVCCTCVMQLYRFGYFINFFDARKRMHHFRDVAFSLHLSARSEQKWVLAEATKSVFFLQFAYNTRNQKKTMYYDWLSQNGCCVSGFLISPFHLQFGSVSQLLPPPFPCKCKCNWSLLSSLDNVPVLMISDTRYLHIICGLPPSLFWSILSPCN